MKKLVIKKIILILGTIALIGNASPLFAMIVELQVLGGGYKLQGPDQINFSPISSSAYPSTQSKNLRDIALETLPDGTTLRSMVIFDKNGSNPFDVIVSASEMKRDETLQTTTAAGSSGNNLIVASGTGFSAGDTIIITGYADNVIQTITSVSGNTLTLQQEISGPINDGMEVNRIVDCNLTPKKCISLSSLSIKNNDNNGDAIIAIGGQAEDLSLNPQTNDYAPFKGETVTIDGSLDSTLKVNDSSTFQQGEAISFPADSNVMPKNNNIVAIGTEDNHTITLQYPFIIPPVTDITVQSSNSRTLTLASGTGAAPGEFEIHPSLQETVQAGQLPGLYKSTLNFTIV